MEDISNEVRHYRKHFENKVVFCNCDDPFESNFFKYFAMNFNSLKLKKLICTCYAGSPVSYSEFKDLPIFQKDVLREKLPYVIQITEVNDINNDGAVDMDDIISILLRNENNNLSALDGDGDFRSDESIAFLEEADIVVTNPPFSLFREYISQLIKYNKKFLIIGSQNAITYKEFFPLIKNNKLWIGSQKGCISLFFEVPKEYKVPDSAKKVCVAKLGEEYCEKHHMTYMRTACWFTNLDISKRHEELILYKNYTQEEYPTYDNYDAINVDKTSEIPMDYDGVMGVPITFLYQYCPEQFTILALGNSRENFTPSKNYINPKKHLKDGTVMDGGAINCVLAIEQKTKPVNKTYYTSDNSDYLVPPYARILIRRKQ